MKDLSNITVIAYTIAAILLITLGVLALISPNVSKDWYSPLATERYND
jgi:hypothetical protein